MEGRRLSLAAIQDAPGNSLMLLAGPPGAGKSRFCRQVVLNSVAGERPVIFVTTEQTPDEVISLLGERGLGEPATGMVSFVDAFTETVGLACTQRADTLCASCVDLNSISMATTRLRERVGKRGILLAFDSLTSPYLFSGAEVVKFMRLFLSRLAAEGNSVVALVDEGCGKEQDLVAMMSAADGVIRMEMGEGRQLLNVVKHPRAKPTRIEVPIEPEEAGLAARVFDPSALKQLVQAMALGSEKTMRPETGNYVNLFWPNLAHWSGMLWDPKRFPIMRYEFNKADGPEMIKLLMEDEAVRRAFPWTMRLFMRLFVPKNFGKVKDMRRMCRAIRRMTRERAANWEYLDDVSKTDEHTFRMYECSDCWGFENVGVPMASYIPPVVAGTCKAFELWNGLERDWNAIETKCIGLGDPYCEFRLVPGRIDGLEGSLQKDSSVIERIHQRLMDRLVGFLLHGRPLVERPGLGSDIYIHAVFHTMGFPHMAGARYQMALRMGGARVGKELGGRLMGAGLNEEEAVKKVLHFLEHCKVGQVAMNHTIVIRENCESLYTKLFKKKWKEPSCFFTTGFLNGLFSAVKGQHVREIRCIAAGDPYCEWEIV